MMEPMKKSSGIFHFLLLFCTLPLFLTGQLHAFPTLELTDATYEKPFPVECFKENGEWPISFQQIEKAPFKQECSSFFSMGYSDTPVWIRFRLRNPNREPLETLLEITEVFHHRVELYYGGTHAPAMQHGLRVPFLERTTEHFRPTFPIRLAPESSVIIYLKIETTYGVFGAIEFKSQKQFIRDTTLRHELYAFYFGGALTTLLYNLLIFFYLRERIYFYYVGHVAAFIVWVMLYSGVALNVVDEGWYGKLQVSVPLFFIMLGLFSQAILETRKYFPFLHHLLSVYLVLITGSMVWMMLSLHSGFQVMNILVMPLLPLLMYLGIIASLRGNRIAMIYSAALLVYFIGMSLVSALYLGLIPYSTLVRNAPLAGSLIEITLFSLALAYRINLLRKERQQSQQKLYQRQRHESALLGEMVEKKTRALNDLNLRLEQELDERKALETQLKHQATTDALSGILNRKAFFDRCEAEANRAKRESGKSVLIILDIDFFKRINDTYGHPGGDKVIVDIVKRINTVLRISDVFGRIGGEEFAILVLNTEMAQARTLAERIRKAVGMKPFDLDDNTIDVTVSLGVSTFDPASEQIRAAFVRADDALYRAKHGGRNRVESAPDDGASADATQRK